MAQIDLKHYEKLDSQYSKEYPFVTFSYHEEDTSYGKNLKEIVSFFSSFSDAVASCMCPCMCEEGNCPLHNNWMPSRFEEKKSGIHMCNRAFWSKDIDHMRYVADCLNIAQTDWANFEKEILKLNSESETKKPIEQEEDEDSYMVTEDEFQMVQEIADRGISLESLKQLLETIDMLGE